MTAIDLSLRQTTLTILAAFLIVTAGCTAGIGGDTGEENAVTETPERITPEDGDDLRTFSFEDEFGYVEEFGELDGSDPRGGDKVYEPIEFVGYEARYYNFTMNSPGSSEEMRLIDPDGEVVAVATGDSDTPAEFEMVRLNKTGKYTLHATSVEANETFTYSLTVNEVMYAGDPEKDWGEYERYSQFASLSEYYWEELSQQRSNATFASVNVSEDYVVIEYDRDPDANYTVQNSDYAFMARTLVEVRNYIANHPEGLQRENPEEWYPERVYFTGYNEEGELVQTNYVSQRWTDQFMSGGNEDTDRYFYRVVGTTKYGPAHNKYPDASANKTIEEDQFPYPAYPEEYIDFPTA